MNSIEEFFGITLPREKMTLRCHKCDICLLVIKEEKFFEVKYPGVIYTFKAIGECSKCNYIHGHLVKERMNEDRQTNSRKHQKT